MKKKTPGERAYEEDVRRHPQYDDGGPRVPWSDLLQIARETWESNPVPRDDAYWRKINEQA